MLSTEETERIHRYSVEFGRQRYSNEHLWARLNELNDREIEIVQLIPTAYRLAFSWRADAGLWREHWNRLLNELSASRPVIELIIWHLTRRGDDAIAGWLSAKEEAKRQLAVKAQHAAWRLSL
jgi:hypothetical protein